MPVTAAVMRAVTVLTEPLDEQPHLRHQRVDPHRLSVKERPDGTLFIDGREGEYYIA